MISPKKIIIPTMAIIGVIASVVSTPLLPDSNSYEGIMAKEISANSAWSATDPRYFGDDKDYLEVSIGSFQSPYTVRDNSDLIITGQIIDKAYDYDFTSRYSSDETPIPIIKYDVSISEVKKGKYFDKTITIPTYIISNLDFDVGDNILVMAKINDISFTIESESGSFGMFKIIDDKLIGHEITLSISDLVLE